MTPQQIFNTVYLGLKAQGFGQSVDPLGSIRLCLYRGPDETKCAVGHCIPDNVYTPDMEQLSVSVLVRRYGLTDLIPHIKMLEGLQTLHDSCNFPQQMEMELKSFADKRGLGIPQ